MSALIVRDAHSSWYTPAPGQENRNIAAEAYQTGIEHLKNELGIPLNGSVPTGSTASAKDVLVIVETAKRKYEDKSNDHNSTRQWLERFSSRVMYYGKIFDTLAQHHPEYVALAWGAVKLVLTGVINRATLVQKLSQALVAIGDVLPRADLSAELYQTDYMETALSRLYGYIILFLQLCVRWYNRSPLGRLWSSITSPFELDYQDLAEQIQLCSKAVDDLANAGARAEIRHIRTVLELHHAQSRGRDTKLLEMQKKFDDSMVQLLQLVTSSKTITERMSGDVRGISKTVYRIEFHHVVQFFAPELLPEAALLKVRSLALRGSTPTMHNPNDLKVRNMIRNWALAESSSLLIVRVGLRAQKQAKELATNVIESLKSSDECVFWNVSLSRTSKSGDSMVDLFKGLIFQVLQHAGGLFSDFAEQLNLAKINSPHTENEWVDLICLLFSKLPKAFIVIETEALHKAYQHEPAWVERLCRYLRNVVNRSSAAGNKLKLLLVLYGNSYQIGKDAPESKNVLFTALQPPTPIPLRLRHVARRSGLDAKGWLFRRPKLLSRS